MQKLGSQRVAEHIQPVMSATRRRPFELPGFRVAEEVHFGQAPRARLLDRERREDLEGRPGGELRVVPGLEQEQPVVEARAVRRRDASIAGFEKEQLQPAGLGRGGREAGLGAGVGQAAGVRVTV